MQYNIGFDYYAYHEKGRNRITPSLFIRYRALDQLNLVWDFDPVFSNNEMGFAGKNSDHIFMGRRQRNTYENTITGNYTLNNTRAFSLPFRHYFSDVTYKPEFD